MGVAARYVDGDYYDDDYVNFWYGKVGVYCQLYRQATDANATSIDGTHR